MAPTIDLASRSDVPHKLYMDIINFLQQEKEEKVALNDLAKRLRELIDNHMVPAVKTQEFNSLQGASHKSSKVFVLYSLLRLLANSSLANSSGKLEVRPKELIHVLLENLMIPRLWKKYAKLKLQNSTDVYRFAEERTLALTKPTTGNEDQEVQSQETLRSTPTISLKLARWHNSKAWSKAYFVQKSTSDMILNEGDKIKGHLCSTFQLTEQQH